MISINKTFYIIIPLALCFTLFTYFSHADNNASDKKEIYLLTNNKLVGDSNQIKGVARYLSLQENIKIEEYSLDDLPKLVDHLVHSKQGISTTVIAAGAWGIPALKEIASKSPDTLTVHLSHQLFQDHEQLLKNETNPSGISLVAVASHAIDSEWLSKTKQSATLFLPTTGVCHNVTVEELEKEYEKYKTLIPQAQNYCVVILGGDAEQPDKSWSYYTSQDALKLAEMIYKNVLEKNQYLIILNGPRTGKHNSETGLVDPNAHKNNELDLVTQSFMNYFTSVGFEKMTLFDFQFGQPSMYKPVLGAALHCKLSEIFVPGESISMASEVIDSMAGSTNKVILYEHSAMNSGHEKYVAAEYQSGRAAVLCKTGEYKEQLKGHSTIDSAAQTTANKILTLLNINQ